MSGTRTKRAGADARTEDGAAAPAAPERRAHGRNALRTVLGIPGLMVNISRHADTLGALAVASSGTKRDVAAARAHERLSPPRWVAHCVNEFERLHAECARWRRWPAAGSEPPRPMELGPTPSPDAVLLYFSELDKAETAARGGSQPGFWGRLPMLDAATVDLSEIKEHRTDVIAKGVQLCGRVPNDVHGLARLVLYERTFQPTHLTQAPIFLTLQGALTELPIASLHEAVLEASAVVYRFLIVPSLLTKTERDSFEFSGLDFSLFYHRGSLPLGPDDQLDDHFAKLTARHIRWDWVMQALSSRWQAEWEQMRERLREAPA